MSATNMCQLCRGGIGLDPASYISDAKKTVKLVEHAEDEVLLKVQQMIGSKIKSPKTCGHPGEKLSKATVARNQLYQELYDKVGEMMNDPIPF